MILRQQWEGFDCRCSCQCINADQKSDCADNLCRCQPIYEGWRFAASGPQCIDELDFSDYEESHAFGEIYETILKELQSAGSAGEFYTPRAVTDFMAQVINPKIGETMADLPAVPAVLLSAGERIEETG